jgi:hypothetical protein
MTDATSELEWYSIRIRSSEQSYKNLDPGSFGEYKFTLRLDSQNDSGTEVDAPGDVPTTISMPDFSAVDGGTSTVSITGSLGSKDTSDCYIFRELSSGDVVYRFRFGMYTGPVRVSLFTLNETIYQFRSYEPYYHEDEIFTLRKHRDDDGPIFLKIYLSSDKRTKDRQYEVIIDAWPQSDAETGFDAPYRTPYFNEDSENITLFRKLYGFIGGRTDNKDVFKLSVQKGKTMFYTATPVNEDTLKLGLSIIRYDNTAEMVSTEGEVDRPVTLTYQPKTGGFLYLMVEAIEGWGHYSLGEQPVNPPPYLGECMGIGTQDRNILIWTIEGEKEQITGFEIYKVPSENHEVELHSIEYNESHSPIRVIDDPDVRSFEDFYPSPGIRFTYKVVPLMGDLKLDGLVTIAETPYSPGDEDRDGIPDIYEYMIGLDPDDRWDGKEDKDGDGFNNYAEFIYGSNPLDRNSTPESVGMYNQDQENDMDLDGMDNEWEELHGLDPMDSSDAWEDPDSDGMINLVEFRDGKDPNNEDGTEEAQDDGGDDNDSSIWPALVFLAVLVVIIAAVYAYKQRSEYHDLHEEDTQKDHKRRSQDIDFRR